MVDLPSNQSSKVKKQIPVEEGVFYQPQLPGEKPYLIGTRCKTCGYTSFPRLAVCPSCLKKDSMEIFHLSGTGTIDTFSNCFSALPGFPAPTIQGYILIDNARIWSQLTGTEPTGADLKAGMEVELVIEKLREDSEGNEIVSYKFKPTQIGQKGMK